MPRRLFKRNAVDDDRSVLRPQVDRPVGLHAIHAVDRFEVVLDRIAHRVDGKRVADADDQFVAGSNVSPAGRILFTASIVRISGASTRYGGMLIFCISVGTSVHAASMAVWRTSGLTQHPTLKTHPIAAERASARHRNGPVPDILPGKSRVSFITPPYNRYKQNNPAFHYNRHILPIS